MNSFKVAFDKLIKYEGGYVNDPDDKGGETYKGIARNSHPDWEGWDIIDAFKSHTDFPNLPDNASLTLDSYVKSFYKEKFWDIFYCDQLPDSIAEEIFEVAVNTGISRATKIIQSTCNLLNRNQLYYSDIVVDGKYGKITASTFKNCIDKNGEDLVYNVMNILQGSFYIDLMQKKSVYEKYIGWFKRVEIRRK